MIGGMVVIFLIILMNIVSTVKEGYLKNTVSNLQSEEDGTKETLANESKKAMVPKKQLVRKKRAVSPVEIIGIWRHEHPIVGSRITIFRQNGKLFMESAFIDGNSMTERIVETPSANGLRFETRGKTRYSEWYLMDKQGNLQIWDQIGLFSTAKRIGG